MIRLYDTMMREKRLFVPQNDHRVTMYVCGPTVYGRAHIGNARPAVVFDTLARLIRHTYGEKSLVYARNITDVDDKIIDAAKVEGVEPAVITERYERFYLEDMGALGVQPPELAPHATHEIQPMVAMIERLIELGHAYAAEGHVLFHVPSDPSYGVLSRRDRDAMLAGARVEVAPYKRDPADFVLWKPSKPEVVGWNSPWGRGRPGWHIECSAMIRQHLGETIDIHGGGIDLIFPHHENEIAQSRCAHGGIPLARYWVHNGFVDMGAEKMSKSLGNVVLVNELLSQGHRGEVLRLALLSAHYRQPLPWTEKLLQQSKATLDRWYRAYAFYEEHYAELVEKKPDAQTSTIKALQDDLNTPLAIAELSSAFNFVHAARSGGITDDSDLFEQTIINAVFSAKMMGFLHTSSEDWFRGGILVDLSQAKSDRLRADLLPWLDWLKENYGQLPEGDQANITEKMFAVYVPVRIKDREEARKRKDFQTADSIRDELRRMGIVLEDGPNGTTWRRE